MTLRSHVWTLALAFGPDRPSVPYRLPDGTPVDVRAHLEALDAAIIELERRLEAEARASVVVSAFEVELERRIDMVKREYAEQLRPAHLLW